MSSFRGTKKRKANAPLEPDSSLYASFSTAATSVSQLFATAHAQVQRGYYAGARDEAERLLSWARTQHEAGTQSIGVAELVAALTAEAAELEEAETRAQSAAAAGVAAAATAHAGGASQQAAGGAAGRASPFKAAGWASRGMR